MIHGICLAQCYEIIVRVCYSHYVYLCFVFFPLWLWDVFFRTMNHKTHENSTLNEVPCLH